MSRQDKVQELVRMKERKPEKKGKKKPPRSSAALTEAECMMQGLMGVVRGYRVCLFRPERTSSQMSCGRPFLNRTQTEGYRLVWPRPSCRAAFENTAVSAYVSVSVHQVKRAQLWRGSSPRAAAEPAFLFHFVPGRGDSCDPGRPPFPRSVSVIRTSGAEVPRGLDRSMCFPWSRSQPLRWEQSPKYRPPNSSDLLTCVWRCVVGQITES